MQKTFEEIGPNVLDSPVHCAFVLPGRVVHTNSLGVILLPAFCLRLLAPTHQMFTPGEGKELFMNVLLKHVEVSLSVIELECTFIVIGQVPRLHELYTLNNLFTVAHQVGCVHMHVDLFMRNS